MLYRLNRYRRSTRCLSWRWDRWRPARCTWAYWHARHTTYHVAGRTGKVWYVNARFQDRLNSREHPDGS
jgi:hypothetical protein